MLKKEVVNLVLKNSNKEIIKNKTDFLFAPTNIALIKYWGKRDENINLPLTNSLSMSIDNMGAKTKIKLINTNYDIVKLNGKLVDCKSDFYIRIKKFLDLFRFNKKYYFQVDTKINIPVAAGVASSSCGFAALVKSLNELYQWNLNNKNLSILSRIGSGSACRSIDYGFVEWNKGIKRDGMDSYGKKLNFTWDDLCIGILICSKKSKYISSREAMKISVKTSKFYKVWPEIVKNDLKNVKKAIKNKDFNLLGKTAESNAMSMHSIMMSSNPSVFYFNKKTVEIIEKIRNLRNKGIHVYFTQDAGPSIKILYLRKDYNKLINYFNI